MYKIKSCISQYPLIMGKFDYDKNEGVDISKIGPGSEILLWFRCEKGHSFQAFPITVNVKSKNGGCTYCAGKTVSYENSLAAKRPDIAKEWDYGVNGQLTPSNVSYGSSRIAGFICDNGHQWKCEISSRTKSIAGTNCPSCNGDTPTSTYNLQAMFPKIAMQLSKKNNIDPSTLMPFSAKRLVWDCDNPQCGKEWVASVKSLTSCKTNCPNCKSSHGEKSVRKFLDDVKLPYIFQYRPRHRSCPKLSFDFAVLCPSGGFRCFIEFQGIQHYEPYRLIKESGRIEYLKKCQRNDMIKEGVAWDLGVPLLKIKYTDLKIVDSILSVYFDDDRCISLN